MNIKEAKEEIKHTLLAYNRKDAAGRYTFPKLRQRPILLMGPPGIGKTAIMEQVAEECNVGLVAYTITHHTRQSAVGLPRIVTRCYNGKEVSITVHGKSFSGVGNNFVRALATEIENKEEYEFLKGNKELEAIFSQYLK